MREVLSRPDLFEVPYGPEMTELAGGTNFVLGLEGPAHDRQNAIIRSVLRPTDLDRIRTLAAHYTQILIEGSGGRIDVMKDLMTRVATETCCSYFGLDPDNPDAFAEWAMSISALLFADPFGNAETRQLALNGAAQIRDVIDRAIARAKAAPETETVIGRLVGQLSDGVLTEGEIRAIVVGLVTGFIPTNTLAAGKILDDLLSRPKVWQDAIACAQADDGAGLEAILLEAGRLNPALAPGQWRYARHDGVIAHNTSRQKTIKAGSVLMVATMSALRDKRAFVSPGEFRADRPNPSSLMFGDGLHACLGMHVAVAQIGEVFRVLLKQPNLRTAAASAGAIGWVGPFPRRLEMEFEPCVAPQAQNMVIICAPVRAEADLAALRAQIEALGNPARPDVVAALSATNIVHFASMTLIDAGAPDKPSPHLLLELNVDGSPELALRAVTAAAGEWLSPIFAQVDAPAGTPLLDILRDNVLDLQTRPWGAIGLNFNGTPEFAVADIVRQRDLAQFATDALEEYLEESRLPRQPRHGGARLCPQADQAGSRAEAADRSVAGFAPQGALAGAVRARRRFHQLSDPAEPAASADLRLGAAHRRRIAAGDGQLDHLPLDLGDYPRLGADRQPGGVLRDRAVFRRDLRRADRTGSGRRPADRGAEARGARRPVPAAAAL